MRRNKKKGARETMSKYISHIRSNVKHQSVKEVSREGKGAITESQRIRGASIRAEEVGKGPE